MSSRPLFVKRSRIIHRVIVFGISLLILAVVVAVAVWKIKGFGDLAFIKSPFMSSEAVIAAVIPDHIQSDPESTSNIPKQTEVSAVAILVKTQPTEKANTVAHTWQNNQQKVDDKAFSLRTALDLWSKAWSTQDVPT